MTATAQPPATASVHARRRLVGTSAIVVSVVVPPFLLGALATRIGRDIDFGTTHLGLALATCYLVTSVLSPLGGRFVARVGAEGALRTAGLMTTLGLLAIASAGEALHLIVALAFVGVPNALTQPASNEILSRIEEPRLRALSFGLVQASIPTASLIAGSVLAVASYGTSWRGSMLAVAALTIAAQFLLPRSPRPGRAPRLRVRRPAPDVRPAPLDQLGGPPLMIALVVTGALASAAATALPTFAATTGLAGGVAPWLVAGAQIAGSITSIVVRVAAPWLTSGASLRQRLHTVALLLTLGLLAMLGLSTGTTTGFVLGSIAAFGFGWGWNGLFNLIVALARPQQIAAATGLTQSGVFLGGTVGPLCFALIAQDDNFRAAWITMAGLMAVAVLAAAYAARRAGHAVPSYPRPEESI